MAATSWHIDCDAKNSQACSASYHCHDAQDQDEHVDPSSMLGCPALNRASSSAPPKRRHQLTERHTPNIEDRGRHDMSVMQHNLLQVWHWHPRVHVHQ
jgi:hypothetical protein